MPLSVSIQSTLYPWQQAHWKHLVDLMHRNRLPHALLLTGQEGWGQAAFAQSFATLLLCEQQKEGACGICAGCELMASKTHPDFYTIVPAVEGGAIKIEQIRDLAQDLSQRSFKGGWKVVIIDPLEAANIASLNGLLKQLEEPPEQTLFILMTYQVAQILPTIVSRCQALRFYAPESEVLPWIAHQTSTAMPAIQTLWHLYGSPLKILAALAENQLAAWDIGVKKLLEIRGLIHLSQELEEQSAEKILAWMTMLVMEGIRLKCGQKTLLLNDTMQNALYQLFSPLPLERCYAVLHYYYQRRADLNRQVSLNQSLFILSLLIPWSHLLHGRVLNLHSELV